MDSEVVVVESSSHSGRRVTFASDACRGRRPLEGVGDAVGAYDVSRQRERSGVADAGEHGKAIRCARN